MSKIESLGVGLAMNSRGAVELIIASIGLQAGIIDGEIFSLLVLVSFGTTLISILGIKPLVRRIKKDSSILVESAYDFNIAAGWKTVIDTLNDDEQQRALVTKSISNKFWTSQRKFIIFVKGHIDDIILLIGVVLISLLSFAMGYIFAKQQEKTPLKIGYAYSNYWSRNNGIIFGLEIG